MPENSKTEIAKTYTPKTIEKKWYQTWLDKKYFQAKSQSDQPSFSIVIPPPNITGSLHTGHALDNTLQDTLIRWKRMQGFNTLWMPGTDHAGIVTELIMEQKLLDEGTSRQELGRENFIQRMWEWKDESRGRIIDQLQQIGCSCDWERERFTLDDGLSQAVRSAFVKLFKKGLIFRGDYMVNWCPHCQTAVSDLEVEAREIDGHFYHLLYPIKDSDKVLEIATTRPETMLGDTAVAVNPSDNRYKDLIGQTVILPVLGREIPIIADNYVDLETGTGALKVTPAHDPNDYEIGKRHELDQINILNNDGTLNQNVGDAYQGMDRFAARRKLVERLQKTGQLIKIEPHRHAVGHHDRCGHIVEPYLSPQWYVNVKPLAERALSASKNGDIVFIPERETKRFHQWMENIQPWAISRRRWWGHQIPIWYCDDCEALTCELEDPAVCSGCGSSNIHRDTDVLDTWFSSGLWPFSTMGWPEQTDLLASCYPTSVLVTGWDILFFWVSRMIMLGLECTDKVPFQHVYLHGLVADETGQKMSKSKGNTIDPVETIDCYGADAFRFAIVYCTIPSPYMPLPEYQIEAGKRFTNKIWNASRFLLMNIDDEHLLPEKERDLQLADHWIRSRFNQTTSDTLRALDQFRFSDAAHVLYEFIWHEFCDWYVEMIKQRLYYADDTVAKRTAQSVAVEILDGVTRLLHPIMPFITEEIWQNLPMERSCSSIMIDTYPRFDPDLENSSATREMKVIMDTIDAIRSLRGEMNVPPSSQVEILIQAPKLATRQTLQKHLSQYLSSFTKFSQISISQHQEKPTSAATAVVNELTIYVPLEGVIDLEKEKKRLQKRLAKVNQQVQGVRKQLDNENFVSRAPIEVVEQKRQLLADFENEQEKLEANLKMLS